MATYTQGIRRGLPRHPGGPGWPDVAGAVAATVPALESHPPAAAPASHAPAATAVAEVALRQGLPRVPGGEPWPPAGVATVERVSGQPSAVPAASATTSAAAAASAGAETTVEVTLRRGLPRVAGGEPWPPASTATVSRVIAPAVASGTAPAPATASGPVPVTAVPTPAPAAPTAPAAPAAPAASAVTPAPAAPAPRPSAARPATPAAPAAPAAPAREPRVIRGRTVGSWARILVGGGLAVVAAAGIIVLAARGVTTLPGVPEFLDRYPGAYAPPESAPVGFPAWLNWMHYLNFFFLALIVRTGLGVRRQKTPPAYWAPRTGGKKISLTLWLHTSVDILWLANGIAFVVLLFVTGQWMRIVPTSWEVFPNALSAGLQYLMLDWPTEHGWVYYNSLQQLMYFVVVFVAAPLAAITGARMSEWWPKEAERLNRIYPAPVARAIHFPTMLFFVLFVIVHVFLVFTTGARRNLNHMFAATDTVSWAGFAWFAAGLVVAAGVVAAARPLVVAPIASLFGRVSSR